jgi:hypothetical protein
MSIVTAAGVGIVKKSYRQPQVARGVYCCLIGNSLKDNADKETYVFVANDPAYATVLHNQRLTSTKETRSIAPFWHLVLVLGPFVTGSLALACAQRWVNCTRGCNSKIRKGRKLAQEETVNCYDDSVAPPGGTLAFLKRHAPRPYARAYQRLVQTPPSTPIKTRALIVKKKKTRKKTMKQKLSFT